MPDSASLTDAFALLGLPRRLDLKEADIEEAWRALSLRHHPDRPGGDAALSAGANEARETLRRPGPRLRHWLALHGQPAARSAALDPATMDLFSAVAEGLAKADDALRRKAAATSAIGRATVAAAELQAQLGLQALQGRLTSGLTQAVSQFSELDSRFTAEGLEAVLKEARTLAATLAFLEKWEAQCREKLLALATSAL
ncbi:MAG: J domain-containing protein [Verrucomicrobiales bacterium]